MHIYIVGGSGRTGQLVIETALKRGHTVTALVRNPDSLQPRPGLTIAKGTPLSQPDIDASLPHPRLPSAVIVTLSAPRASDSPFAAPLAPPRMMADAHAHLAAAMRAHAVRRIVTLSALGVGDSAPSVVWPLRWLLRRSNMRFQFRDHDLVDAEMKDRRDLAWVGVRPAMLTEGEEEREVKVWGDRGVGAPWLGKVARRSVAAFLVDMAEGREGVGRTPVITN